MAAQFECPVCHYQGAALPFNGDDQVQCPGCKGVYALTAVERDSSTADALGNTDSNMRDDSQDSSNDVSASKVSAEAIAAHEMDEARDGVEDDSTAREIPIPNDEEDESPDDPDEDWDEDESDDDESDADKSHGGRIIRMRCPNCSAMVELSKRAVDVTISALWDRMQNRNEPIRVRCPACSSLVELQRRRRHSILPPQQAPYESAPAFGPSNPAHESNGSPLQQPPSLPDPVRRSPSLAWQLLWPKKYRNAASPHPAKSRSPLGHRRREPRPLPLKQFAIAATLISAVAVLTAFFTTFSSAVTPLAVVGLLVALGTLAVTNGSRLPRRWPLVASVFTASILVLVAFYPIYLGQKYSYYRSPELNPDFVRVAPKMGQHPKELPNDPEWVDASKYGLDRDWFHAEIAKASIGPVEVRLPSGAGTQKIESHLVIVLSYGRVHGFESVTNQNEAQNPKLEVTVVDEQGQTYDREDLVPSAQFAKSKKLGRYTGGTIEESMVFKTPATIADALHVEVRIPNLGTTPLRFRVPKTMIFTVTATPGKSPNERAETPRSRNDE